MVFIKSEQSGETLQLSGITGSNSDINVSGCEIPPGALYPGLGSSAQQNKDLVEQGPQTAAPLLSEQD